MTLIDSLDVLSHQMLAVANRMQAESEADSEVVQHAQELLGAVLTLRTWIDGLRDKESKE